MYTIQSLKDIYGTHAVPAGSEFIVRVKSIEDKGDRQKLRIWDSTGEINVTVIGGRYKQGDMLRYVGSQLVKKDFPKDGVIYPFLHATDMDFEVVGESEARQLDKTRVKLIEHWRICAELAREFNLGEDQSTFATLVIQSAQQGLTFTIDDLEESLTLAEMEEHGQYNKENTE